MRKYAKVFHIVSVIGDGLRPSAPAGKVKTSRRNHARYFIPALRFVIERCFLVLDSWDRLLMTRKGSVQRFRDKVWSREVSSFWMVVQPLDYYVGNLFVRDSLSDAG